MKEEQARRLVVAIPPSTFAEDASQILGSGNAHPLSLPFVSLASGSQAGRSCVVFHR